MRLPALATLIFLLGCAAPADAQESAKLSLSYHVIKPSFGQNNPLSLEVELRNVGTKPLSDLRVAIGVFPRVRSRSELRSVLDAGPRGKALEIFTVKAGDLKPGERKAIAIEEPLAEKPALDDAPDGVYPMTIGARRSTGPMINEVNAAAVLVQVPQLPTRLRILPVATLVPEPFLKPDGSAKRFADLAERVEEIASLPGGLTVAMSPLLVAEVAFLPSSEDRDRLLKGLTLLASKSQLVTIPFTNIGFSSALELDQSLSNELTHGSETLRNALGASPVDLIYAAEGTVDDRTLTELHRDDEVLVATSDLGTVGGTTAATPVVSRGVNLIPTEYFVSPVGAVAESAMTYFEAPARNRTLAMTIDATRPGAASLLTELAAAPWVTIIRPDELQATTTRLTRPLRKSVRPPSAYRTAVADAKRSVEVFESFVFPGNELLGRLKLVLEGAEGTAWWDQEWSKGASKARELVKTIDAQKDLVSTASGPVTFTSQRGQVPVTVVNRTAYPVRVRVDLESSQLRFPSGSSRRLNRLEPPGETLTFAALAQQTGTFPIQVLVRTPTGAVIHRSEVVVRSTAANVLALTITVGAAAFLLVWYVIARRRRRA